MVSLSNIGLDQCGYCWDSIRFSCSIGIDWSKAKSLWRK